MSLNKQDRRDIASDGNYVGRQTTKYAIWAVVLVLVLGAVVWGVYVVTSEIRGQGDAVRQRNSAENWVKQQEDFNRRYQSIKAMDKNITVAADALKRDPDSQVKQINYDGLVRNCNEAVGEYNSKAREFNSEKFRDADLPAELPDPSDPLTDCKEN